MKMHSIKAKEALQDYIGKWKSQGRTVAFVPTMGALHAGHISLIDYAKKCADKVVVSIFVNPKQFGPNEDYEAYPRQEAEDIEKLEKAHTDLLYMPDAETMFPVGFSTGVKVERLSEGLCSATRPNFFEGITTVVTKLLLQVKPDIAVFGKKDYQQLLVIQRLVKDLDIPVIIKGVETLREKDGLALSSRNNYLNKAQRAVAPHLSSILNDVAIKLEDAPHKVEKILNWGKAVLDDAGFDQVDYLELRDARTLEPLQVLNKPARLLAAAYLGKCRLIDNIAVNLERK